MVLSGIKLNKFDYMTIRKLFCILLTMFFGLGLFTTGAVAKSGCKDQSCKQMLRSASHHLGKAMPESLLSDCCAGPHTLPCEFERSRKKTVLHLYLFSGHVERNNFAGTLVKVKGDFTEDRLPMESGRSVLFSFFQSAPIYLQNQTLIV